MVGRLRQLKGSGSFVFRRFLVFFPVGGLLGDVALRALARPRGARGPVAVAAPRVHDAVAGVADVPAGRTAAPPRDRVALEAAVAHGAFAEVAAAQALPAVPHVALLARVEVVR